MNPHVEFWAVATYSVYAMMTCGVTVWVARTLRLHMPGFFVTGDTGKDELIESMTRLIIVGFYLVNFGAISLALKSDERALGSLDAFELLSSRVGAVLLVQGVVHFGILAKLFAMTHKNRETRLPNPVPVVRELEDPNAF